MKSIEDIYKWFVENQQHLRPTEAELYHQQREAERLKCGYMMEKDRPRTFKASSVVPYGTIIIYTSLEELWKVAPIQSPLFADGVSPTDNILELTSRITPSFTVPVTTSALTGKDDPAYIEGLNEARYWSEHGG